MTTDEFRKEFGPDWRKFKKTPLYGALLSVFEEASPARQEMSRIPGDVAVGGVVFFANMQGHEKLVELFRNGLGDPPPVRVEREEEYRPEN